MSISTQIQDSTIYIALLETNKIIASITISHPVLQIVKIFNENSQNLATFGKFEVNSNMELYYTLHGLGEK